LAAKGKKHDLKDTHDMQDIAKNVVNDSPFLHPSYQAYPHYHVLAVRSK
jgi:hypothetical protein